MEERKENEFKFKKIKSIYYWSCNNRYCYINIFLFNRGKDAGEVVEEYYSHLTKKDYKKMYAMLTRGSLARTSQKVFETRYENIYDGIEAKNMKVKINEVNDNVVNCTISMDTIAGKVSYDNKITVKNDEIVFNEKMLLME